MVEKQELLTQEGYNKLEGELEYLKAVKRKEVAERLKVAISFGDLSENAEYDEAKNEQAQVEERINYLENLLLYAKVIKDDENQKDVVTVGSTVTYKNLKSNKEMTYKIVGTAEADPFEGRISNESPTGKALLNLKVGDTTTVETPGGIVELKVLTVKKG